MSDPYLEKIAQEKHLHEYEKALADAKKEIFDLKQEIIHLKAEVKYERELRIHGADYHKPKDYHARLRAMIEVVKKGTDLTDIHDIVDEAQRRLVRE